MARSLAVFLVVLYAVTASAVDRVADARKRKSADIARLLRKAGLSKPPTEVYVRVFKLERQVELWAGTSNAPLVLVKTYPICAASGELGPKRKEGDLQVPEGLYAISEFNPASNFHLSMKVGYPNASDRVRSDKQHPGGLIYMHGSCASIGCVAIEDDPIEEVYLIALDAKIRRIDIFPARLNADFLQSHAQSTHIGLWQELAPAFVEFETTGRPAQFSVDAAGAYRVRRKT